MRQHLQLRISLVTEARLQVLCVIAPAMLLLQCQTQAICKQVTIEGLGKNKYAVQ